MVLGNFLAVESDRRQGHKFGSVFWDSQREASNFTHARCDFAKGSSHSLQVVGVKVNQRFEREGMSHQANFIRLGSARRASRVETQATR